ncbi:conserved Plasmodium protein, unknown function, partial [Plasmodium malariae]
KNGTSNDIQNEEYKKEGEMRKVSDANLLKRHENYKEMLSKYVNSHKNILHNSNCTNLKDKRAGDKKNRIRKRGVLKLEDLIIKEDKIQENKNNQRISKFYGGVRIKKVSTAVGKSDYITLTRNLNTNLKTVEYLDLIKLPEQEHLNNNLKSPDLDFIEKKKEKKEIEIYAPKWKYPLQMFDKFIFKNRNFDYNKWVPNCKTLCAIGLPFHLNEFYLLHTLIDMYYNNKNYDGVFDIMCTNEDNFLIYNNILELYTCMYENHNRYELLAANLGILKFEYLFGTQYCSAKNDMLPPYLYHIFKDFYRFNSFPIGGLGLIHFKNEKYAKDFCVTINNYTSHLYEKYIKLIPDINGLKVFLEATVYYQVPDSLFTQINYNELNIALSIIQKNMAGVIGIINELKNYYKQKNIWNLIFANIDLQEFYKKNIEPGNNMSDVNGKVSGNNHIGNNISKDNNCYDTTQELLKRIKELPFRDNIFPNFLVRIYNTYINRYLISNGFCLLGSPYLDEEAGQKVADFLKKFYLLDWFYNEKDETCYFYIFKPIINAFAVFRRLFNASISYSVCTLFLKLPFGLVPAMFIQANMNVGILHVYNGNIIPRMYQVQLNVNRADFSLLPFFTYDNYIRSFIGNPNINHNQPPFDVYNDSSAQRKNRNMGNYDEHNKAQVNYLTRVFNQRPNENIKSSNNKVEEIIKFRGEHTSGAHYVSPCVALFNNPNYMNKQVKDGINNSNLNCVPNNDIVNEGNSQRCLKRTDLSDLSGNVKNRESVHKGKNSENTIIIKSDARSNSNNSSVNNGCLNISNRNNNKRNNSKRKTSNCKTSNCKTSNCKTSNCNNSNCNNSNCNNSKRNNNNLKSGEREDESIIINEEKK